MLTLTGTFLQCVFNPVIFIQSLDYILEERTEMKPPRLSYRSSTFPPWEGLVVSTDFALCLKKPGQGSIG